MKRENDNLAEMIMGILGIVPVVWLALLIAPYIRGGLLVMIENLSKQFQTPFSITWCEDSIKTVLVFLGVYGVGIGVYLSTKGVYRLGEEHGSAKWGKVSKMNQFYSHKELEYNKILTQNLRIGLDGRKHKKNTNVVVIGGSGAGKTRYYALPNIMQANCSMVALDPKGELLRTTGNLLKEKGYEVKVLDLISMENSHCYNPFAYLKKDEDIQKLVTNLFKATTPKGSQSSDPFWDVAASMLLMAIMFYLKYEAPKEEQNFAMVMEMLRAGEVSEEDERFQSILDELFQRLREKNPNHIAWKYYSGYKTGSGKTLKSIQITLMARLDKFNLDSLLNLTMTDELEFDKMGEKKMVIYARISDSDTSFNFLVSMLYTQLFQTLFDVADLKYHGSLPIPVHLVMDEFANVALPDDFEHNLSLMRGRGVSVSIILQNLTQLKVLYEKSWNSVLSNCDTFVYLGGNENETHKYLSEQLGEETIDNKTHGKTAGKSGSYSTNYQNIGRLLQKPDEVRRLPHQYAIVMINGEYPIKDYKYNLDHHPNVKGTTIKGGKPYEHGLEDRHVPRIDAWETMPENEEDTKIEEDNQKQEESVEAIFLLSEEEIETYWKNMEEQTSETDK